MREKHPWQLLFVLALGIFIGSFWFLFGFLTVVGTKAAWWYYLIAVAPGSAIIFLVSMARRSPLPYGVGLMVLGLLLLVISAGRGRLFWTGVAVGIPVLGIGLLFVLWRRIIH